MTIPHFAVAQTDVFVPALAVLTVAALFGVLPVVFAPALRRRRGGGAMRALCIVVAAGALVLAAVQAGSGFRALGDERASVQRAVAQTYGLKLDAAQVSTLVDGGAVQVPGYGPKGVRFEPASGSTDDYRLVFRTASEKSAYQPLPRA